MSSWRCRHGKSLEECSLCFYDLPQHMRSWTVIGKRAAQNYLDQKYKSVRDIIGRRAPKRREE